MPTAGEVSGEEASPAVDGTKLMIFSLIILIIALKNIKNY